MQEILNKQFPFFNAELMDSIVAHGQWVQVAAGEVILKHRAYVKVIPLVSSGLLKVSRLEDDKELLLYYIKPGESCVMSLTACLAQSTKPGAGDYRRSERAVAYSCSLRTGMDAFIPCLEFLCL